MATQIRIVLVTAPAGVKAQKLATALVKEKLVACVNRVPGVESTYWWKDKVETDSEDLLILKTTEELIDPLKQLLNELHPYDVPEMLVLDVEDGLNPYLEWVKESVK